jgi:hypothetical protein
MRLRITERLEKKIRTRRRYDGATEPETYHVPIGRPHATTSLRLGLNSRVQASWVRSNFRSSRALAAAHHQRNQRSRRPNGRNGSFLEVTPI